MSHVPPLQFAGSGNALIRYVRSETLSLLYAETSSTRSGLKAWRTANSNWTDLPNVTSRPNWSFVLVNDRSLFTPESSVRKSGVCTWCEYDRWKSVFSDTGNPTSRRGEIV